ncbi:uncharacterized protein TNCV_2815201 [Trichonephila clavipes]|nr:uncharacterized protein TNCV_2815201 [Trichonephila clavipes]
MPNPTYTVWHIRLGNDMVPQPDHLDSIGSSGFGWMLCREMARYRVSSVRRVLHLSESDALARKYTLRPCISLAMSAATPGPLLPNVLPSNHLGAPHGVSDPGWKKLHCVGGSKTAFGLDIIPESLLPQLIQKGFHVEDIRKMKKFDQTPYNLPSPTPIHVPAEK